MARVYLRLRAIINVSVLGLAFCIRFYGFDKGLGSRVKGKDLGSGLR